MVSPTKITRKNALGDSECSSPYKTKYTVLKFNNQSASKQNNNYSNSFTNESPIRRGLFTNSSNTHQMTPSANHLAQL